MRLLIRYQHTLSISMLNPILRTYFAIHEVLSRYLPYGLLTSGKNQVDIESALQKREQSGNMTKYWQTRKASKLNHKTANIIVLQGGRHCPENRSSVCGATAVTHMLDTRLNWGSMHITTASILCNENRNDPKNTFVLAIVWKGGDHSKVREIIYSNIKTLFFDGTKLVDVQVLLLCNLVDRSERSENTAFVCHMGKLAQRWDMFHVSQNNFPPLLHALPIGWISQQFPHEPDSYASIGIMIPST